LVWGREGTVKLSDAPQEFYLVVMRVLGQITEVGSKLLIKGLRAQNNFGSQPTTFYLSTIMMF
jgi:hypothetical protein